MLVLNLFAGPGAGKSTLAAVLFARLKRAGVSAELVGEFAKDCAWEGRTFPLTVQPYVFAEQLLRLERCRHGGVEVAICDSPLMLSAIYAPAGTPPEFLQAVRAYSEGFDNLNVLVVRTGAYNPTGRFQTETEAVALDQRIRRLVKFRRVVTKDQEDTLTETILRRLRAE